MSESRSSPASGTPEEVSALSTQSESEVHCKPVLEQQRTVRTECVTSSPVGRGTKVRFAVVYATVRTLQ